MIWLRTFAASVIVCLKTTKFAKWRYTSVIKLMQEKDVSVQMYSFLDGLLTNQIALFLSVRGRTEVGKMFGIDYRRFLFSPPPPPSRALPPPPPPLSIFLQAKTHPARVSVFVPILAQQCKFPVRGQLWSKLLYMRSNRNLSLSISFLQSVTKKDKNYPKELWKVTIVNLKGHYSIWLTPRC